MLSNVKNHFHEYWTMHQCLFSWRVSIEIRCVAFWSLSKTVTALPIAGSCFISVLLFYEGDFLVLFAHELFCWRKQACSWTGVHSPLLFTRLFSTYRDCFLNPSGGFIFKLSVNELCHISSSLNGLISSTNCGWDMACVQIPTLERACMLWRHDWTGGAIFLILIKAAPNHWWKRCDLETPIKSQLREEKSTQSLC